MSTEDGTRPSDTVVEPVASTPAEPPDVLPRGKRTKMKRLKKRYADQVGTVSSDESESEYNQTWNRMRRNASRDYDCLAVPVSEICMGRLRRTRNPMWTTTKRRTVMTTAKAVKTLRRRLLQNRTGSSKSVSIAMVCRPSSV